MRGLFKTLNSKNRRRGGRGGAVVEAVTNEVVGEKLEEAVGRGAGPSDISMVGIGVDMADVGDVKVYEAQRKLVWLLE